MQVTPMPTNRASIQEASSASLAPAARAAAKTMAAELVTPMTRAIRPAVTAESGKAERNQVMRRHATDGSPCLDGTGLLESGRSAGGGLGQVVDRGVADGGGLVVGRHPGGDLGTGGGRAATAAHAAAGDVVVDLAGPHVGLELGEGRARV